MHKQQIQGYLIIVFLKRGWHGCAPILKHPLLAWGRSTSLKVIKRVHHFFSTFLGRVQPGFFHQRSAADPRLPTCHSGGRVMRKVGCIELPFWFISSSDFKVSPSQLVPPWQLIWCKSPGYLGPLPEPSTEKDGDESLDFFFPFIVIVNICKNARTLPPVRLEVVTLAATMLIPIPLLRGLFSVTDTTSGSVCATY